jgi:hypothetical protein
MTHMVNGLACSVSNVVPMAAAVAAKVTAVIKKERSNIEEENRTEQNRSEEKQLKVLKTGHESTFEECRDVEGAEH